MSLMPLLIWIIWCLVWMFPESVGKAVAKGRHAYNKEIKELEYGVWENVE